MVKLGKVVGAEIGSNKGGDRTRKLLRVQFEDSNDVQTVELVESAGEDTGVENGAYVFVLSLSESWKIAVAVDDLEARISDANKKRIYGGGSEIRFDSNLKLNGEGKKLVTFEELDTVLQQFITSLNAAFTAKADGSGSSPALMLDISTAELQNVDVGEGF